MEPWPSTDEAHDKWGWGFADFVKPVWTTVLLSWELFSHYVATIMTILVWQKTYYSLKNLQKCSSNS